MLLWAKWGYLGHFGEIISTDWPAIAAVPPGMSWRKRGEAHLDCSACPVATMTLIWTKPSENGWFT
uniref:Uncharacterized protein n=1 Tax=Anguilla anguilla TaxID=7936 RepID=A0A0E9Q3A0_ANGAN